MFWRQKRNQAERDAGPYDVETLELINAELTDRMKRQAESGGRVDTKATFLVGIVTLAVPFVSGRPTASAFAIAAYCAYAVAFGMAVAAAAPVRFLDTPGPRTLLNQSANTSRSKALALLIAARIKAIEFNTNKHRRKVSFWWISVAALAAGVTLSVGGLLHTKSCAQGESAPTGVLAQPAGTPIADDFVDTHFVPEMLVTESKSDDVALEMRQQAPDETG